MLQLVIWLPTRGVLGAGKLFKPDVEKLAKGLSKYCDYLTGQLEAMKRVHMSEKPARQIAENLHISQVTFFSVQS